MIFQRWLGATLIGCAVGAVPVFAQYNNPAAAEDAAIERTRLLRAADQIDLVTRQVSEMQQDMQASRREMDLLREDVSLLRSENDRLKKDLSAAEDRRVQERDAILMEVAKIVAQRKKNASKKTQQDESESESEEAKSDVKSELKAAAEPKTTAEPKKEDAKSEKESSEAKDEDPQPEPVFDIKPDVKEKEASSTKKEKEKEEGYEHVVEKGQTLWTIAQAYQKKGVHVTVEDICKANNIKSGDKLRIGQKLFIPNKK